MNQHLTAQPMGVRTHAPERPRGAWLGEVLPQTVESLPPAGERVVMNLLLCSACRAQAEAAQPGCVEWRPAPKALVCVGHDCERRALWMGLKPGARRDWPPRERRQAILRRLAVRPNATLVELSEGLGLARTQMSEDLNWLRLRHFVRRAEHARWALMDLGARSVALRRTDGRVE